VTEFSRLVRRISKEVASAAALAPDALIRVEPVVHDVVATVDEEDLAGYVAREVLASRATSDVSFPHRCSQSNSLVLHNECVMSLGDILLMWETGQSPMEVDPTAGGINDPPVAARRLLGRREGR
jgi:hypothetical protein